MPFNKVAEFEKSFPSVKNLNPEAKQKALDVFNAIMYDNPGMDEGEAIATAINEAKGANLQEEFKLPQGAINNAKKVLEWKEKHGDEVTGMTEVGWRRARQLASGGSVGAETVKKMAQFARHEKNSTVAAEFKSTPWKDKGYVAWLGWGGDTGINWAKGISENLGEIELLHYLAEIPAAKEGLSDIEVLRVGKIFDRGLEITKEMLEGYVENFKAGVYGTDVQVNLEHKRGSEAAGWVKDLYIAEDKLMAKVEWTELGQEKITKKLYRFVSAELASRFPHARTGEMFKNVFIGLALTNTPALKGQEALALSEDLNIKFNQDIMSKQDKELLNEEEVKEEAPEEVEGGEGEQPEAEEVEAEEPKKEEAAPAEELSEKSEHVSLSEFQALQEANAKLTEKIERKELSEKVSDELMLSSEQSVGFATDEDANDVVNFLIKLSEEQRQEFFALMGKVRSEELGAKGADVSVSLAEKGKQSMEDKIVDLADEYMKEGKYKTIEEAQKMAAKELMSKKK